MTSADASCAFVTAGHRFLLQVLPFRDPESQEALTTFVETAQRIDAPRMTVSLVLLQCLVVLSHHIEHRVPSLLEQYLLDGSSALRNDDRAGG